MAAFLNFRKVLIASRAQARQGEEAFKKRSLHLVNEHFWMLLQRSIAKRSSD
jgi:hypothetical protein